MITKKSDVTVLCPHCGHEQDDIYDAVDYWDNETVGWVCENNNCGGKFSVKSEVQRMFISKATAAQQRELAKKKAGVTDQDVAETAPDFTIHNP